MNEKVNPTEIADDVVVTIDYKLTVNNEIIDTSAESDPLVFIQGYQNIIPGLEKELYGMKVGDSKTVTVTPADGYGDADPESIVDIPRSEFPDDIPLEVGVELDIRDEDDEIMTATIVEVKKDVVVLDFNHPLAGETLVFDVKVLELRAATEEELEHGHVHGEDYDEDDEDFDDDFIEYFEDDDEDEKKDK